MKKFFLLLMSLVAATSVLAFAAAGDGNWNLQGGDPNAPQQQIVLGVAGTTLTGTVNGAAISNGGVQGNALWFRVVRSGSTYSYKGTINGNQMNLYEEPPSGPGRSLTFTRAGA